jgi:small-conductance mechanosensitive channel
MELLQRVLLGNTILAWATALGIAAATLVGLVVVKRIVLRQVTKLSGRTTNEWDDVVAAVLAKTRRIFLFAVAIFIGSRYLTLGANVHTVIRYFVVIITVLQLGFWGRAIVLSLIGRHVERQMETDPGAATTMSALAIVIQLVMWTLLFLMALQNVGIEVAPLIAGLGVGGIAVALAVQNILGDLFASLSIVLDKPFVIGDFVVVGDMSGTIEHVGLKTTRVRSLSGEQIVFSNSDLLSTRIRNFKRMWERRVVFRVGVTYQTPRDVVEQIPVMLRETVEAREKARFDRAHFAAFGPSSLDFEVVYFVTDPNYGVYMDAQQALKHEIMDRFLEAGVEFAYPTQTIFVEGTSTIGGNGSAG